jgi:putative transposase
MVAPAAMREAVAHLQASLGMSERRACQVVGADRKSVRYRSTRPGDADLRERLRALAAERRRFGYRRLQILLRRDGVLVNRKKTQRLYTEEGLKVRTRRSRRRAVGSRAAPPVLALHNQRWSLDFVHDQLASGRRLRVLNIVDDVTRECLAAVPDMRWSRLFGQFGGEVKLIPGFDHAASWSVSVAGACPGNGRFSFAP